MVSGYGSRTPWTIDEDAHLRANPTSYTSFQQRYGDDRRTWDAWRLRRMRIGVHLREEVVPAPVRRREGRDFLDDKVVGSFDWRQASTVIQQMQTLHADASSSQDEASIVFDTDDPIAFVCLSDTHIGSMAADHGMFEAITDEILESGLYIALLGDIQDMAIKMRSVLEVQGGILSAELQHRYVESWLEEIAPRILFSTWDNHAVEREERQAGSSRYADLMKRRVVWHSGIGHPDVTVGDQAYRIACSHTWRGRSIENPVHGAMRYMRREGIDREIALAGDSHVPGMMKYVDGQRWRLAVNAGTLHLGSGYGKRYFSLYAQPVFPVVVLYPHEHMFIPYWNIAEWRRATGR